jgi:hypothetical protein
MGKNTKLLKTLTEIKGAMFNLGPLWYKQIKCAQRLCFLFLQKVTYLGLHFSLSLMTEWKLEKIWKIDVWKIGEQLHESQADPIWIITWEGIKLYCLDP